MSSSAMAASRACDPAACLVPLRPPSRPTGCRHDRCLRASIKRQAADQLDEEGNVSFDLCSRLC